MNKGVARYYSIFELLYMTVIYLIFEKGVPA